MIFVCIFERLFFWFVLYSVAGWVFETIFCSIQGRRFINRGFLMGPFCPIYGCGAVLDIIILGGLKNPFLLFFAGLFLTTLLEYTTGWTLEKVFHDKWWDYSDWHFHFQGRICVWSALAFGAFSLVLLRFIHPFVASLTAKIEPLPLHIICATIFFLLMIDGAFSLFCLKHPERRIYLFQEEH